MGEVLYPGIYSIQSKNEHISDLLERVGGFTPFAYKEGATLVRKKTEEGEIQQEDFLDELISQESTSTESSKSLKKVAKKTSVIPHRYRHKQNTKTQTQQIRPITQRGRYVAYTFRKANGRNTG